MMNSLAAVIPLERCKTLLAHNMPVRLCKQCQVIQYGLHHTPNWFQSTIRSANKVANKHKSSIAISTSWMITGQIVVLSREVLQKYSMNIQFKPLSAFLKRKENHFELNTIFTIWISYSIEWTIEYFLICLDLIR